MPRRPKQLSAVTAAAGSSLLEVMIVVLVMSVGLLGMALMQTTSLRAAHASNERSQATVLVFAMMDKVRANRNDAAVYSLISPSEFFGDGRSGRCAPGAALPAQRWAADRNQWVCAVRRVLPDAQGRVLVTGAVVPPVGAPPGSTTAAAAIEVRLEWCDPRGGILGGSPEFAPAIITSGCTGTTNVILARSGL